MTTPEKKPDRQANPLSLIALEEQLAFQQRHLDQLNDVVRGQQTSLDRLQRELSQLHGLLQRVVERTGDDLPH
jgi:uncharacterized coiled-coil protein SlyX